MIGLDTNVLVRYLVQDDPEQAAAANLLLETRCTRESPGFVSALVLAELIWVLRGAYDYDKSTCIDVLRRILQTAELRVAEPSLVWAALTDFESGAVDFADCLIAQGNHAAGCEVTFTFDRKASASRYFEQVG